MPETSLFSEKVNIGTQRRHKREVWTQIYLPLLLAVALGGFGLFALLSASATNVERGSQTAIILLSIPLLVIGIVLFVVLVGLIYALGVAMKWIPTKTVYAHRYAHQISTAAKRGADLIAKPVLAIESWTSAISDKFQRNRLR